MWQYIVGFVSVKIYIGVALSGRVSEAAQRVSYTIMCLFFSLTPPKRGVDDMVVDVAVNLLPYHKTKNTRSVHRGIISVLTSKLIAFLSKKTRPVCGN